MEVLSVKSKEYIESYWNERLEFLRNEIELSEGKDPLSVSFLELMERAYEHRQYETFNDPTPTTKMVRIRINLPRKLIESLFNVTTTSVYYTGLYIPMEGIYVPEGLRKASNFDNCSRKGVWFDLAKVMPAGFKEEYEERLSIPAMGGLFVPKKSSLTQSGYINSSKQLQFFDVTEW